MDEEYDIIVLGTGLSECIVSGLLTEAGKKVLHIDRNEYYGGDAVGLNLTQLYRKFRADQSPPEELGKDRDWAVDLTPKVIMALGDLTDILVHTDVTRYFELKWIEGSYVFDGYSASLWERKRPIWKVPSSAMEMETSELMGKMEKGRVKWFFEFLTCWKDDDETTHDGHNLDTDNMRTIFCAFGLEPGTWDIIGHAMALYPDDDYLTKPARQTYDRIMRYVSSTARSKKSPYAYPVYGISELPQSFARLGAVQDATFLLNKTIDEIVTDTDGKFISVRSGTEEAKAKQLIGDPSYFIEGVGGKVRVLEGRRVIRAICILKHPIPYTDNSDSCQIIIPQGLVNRKNDIYIVMVSSKHKACAKGYYAATVSTIVETDRPEEEISPGLKLLGPIHDQFVTVSPLYAPTANGANDNIFVTRSLDATSHFESVLEDVYSIWKRVMGTELMLKKGKPADVQ